MHPTFRGSCWPPHWPPPAALPSPPKSSSSKAGTPSNAPPGTTPRSVHGRCRWPGPRRWSVRTARSACSPKTTPGASAFPAQLARRRTAPAARLRPRPAGRQPVLRHPPALESPPVVQRTLGRAELRRLPLHRHQLPRQRTDRRRRRHPGQRPGDLRRSARRAAPHQRRRRQFARFAGNVLGSEDSPANRELLKAALVKRAALIDTLLSMSATDLQPGPGRLDATGQSLNRAAINSGARHLQANPTDAPTSFPALWHTLQMDKLQSSGFVPNVKVLDSTARSSTSATWPATSAWSRATTATWSAIRCPAWRAIYRASAWTT